MGRAYAGILGPLAFATALVRGLIENGDVEATLQSATFILFFFAALGFLVGELASMIVLESVTKRLLEERKSLAAAESGKAIE